VGPEPAAINPLKARLAAGECVAGFMVTMPSVALVQVLAGSGADFLIVDMEHGPIDLATAHAMVAATRGTGQG
jgi:4-hydroxy-2-oxoheptanedioate aldolase